MGVSSRFSGGLRHNRASRVVKSGPAIVSLSPSNEYSGTSRFVGAGPRRARPEMS